MGSQFLGIAAIYWKKSHCNFYFNSHNKFSHFKPHRSAVLVEKLAVPTSTTPLHPVDLEIVDDNVAIYHTLWPKNTTLKTFADNFLKSFDRSHDTYIVFDRYDTPLNHMDVRDGLRAQHQDSIYLEFQHDTAVQRCHYEK